MHNKKQDYAKAALIPFVNTFSLSFSFPPFFCRDFSVIIDSRVIDSEQTNFHVSSRKKQTLTRAKLRFNFFQRRSMRLFILLFSNGTWLFTSNSRCLIRWLLSYVFSATILIVIIWTTFLFFAKIIVKTSFFAFHSWPSTNSSTLSYLGGQVLVRFILITKEKKKWKQCVKVVAVRQRRPART